MSASNLDNRVSRRQDELEQDSMTVQQALDKAGGFGRYQCLLIALMIIGNNGPGLVVYGVAFYEVQPPYECTYNMPQYIGHEPNTGNQLSSHHENHPLGATYD